MRDNRENQNGITLILSILLMSLILFLGIYFLSFSVIEDRIAKSHAQTLQAYYLGEAGLQEMIYRLKNNETYKNNFESDPSWTETFRREDPFAAGTYYLVTVQNTNRAYGEISAVGIVNLTGGSQVQRIVKTTAFKTIGQSAELESAGYADGNIDISFSAGNFYNGSLRSNNNITINGISQVFIADDLKAKNNYIKSSFSSVNIGGEIYAANYPNGPATVLEMPAIDFDSADANSFKNRADVIYTKSEFENLMWNNQNLTLNDPITYVDGDIVLRGGQNLTVNGALIAGRDISIGHWHCWGAARCGNSSITVNRSEGQPAGIFAKRKINFELSTGSININGVVYANDEINVISLPANFIINGGLIGRKLTITSVWQTLNIYLNENILAEALGISPFSPVINIEHWEEEY